jgi:hypothetical protein
MNMGLQTEGPLREKATLVLALMLIKYTTSKGGSQIAPERWTAGSMLSVKGEEVECIWQDPCPAS